MGIILKRWKKNHIKVFIIFLGMLLGILAISIGLSFLEDAYNFSTELNGGNSKVKETLLYKNQEINEKNFTQDLENIVKELNKHYEVSLGSVIYPIDRNASLSDAPSIKPVLYNKNIKWRPNVIYGRNLTLEESLSDEKVAVIGYEIFKNKFKNKEFENNLTIDIYGETYKVIGVIGRTKRYSPQNFLIEIPYKNYFQIYKEEPDIQNIPIYISGNKDFNYYNNKLTLLNKPKYINNIKMPLKLIILIGLLLLLVTIINESNLFSLWILNRKKEFAIKKSLGSTNWLIIKDVLFEMILLSILVAFVALILQFFIQIELNQILYKYELKITLLNFIVSIIVSLIVALITSIVPTKLIISINPCNELKS
ncbi:TPA: FtsX-like permease family protein [Clostridium perfringens]|uniref:ABC transporter permease n=1 Tax=Clostridium perfringens TaxID=1502 RepID=UPI001157813F|nr:ABC transporter permease [Clostridium perfringens]EJT5915552.1 ABC transporter permease [Clostridium perfringens]EJT5926360.1 ABC transporter permease [Clostridium perfringens]MDH5087707.1 macrolide transporter ATP-binding /permease protein [Clostridium perfringens]UBK67511.1 ABC transporter permease [Clostridium perfringens]HAT4129458.1 FtsX-like permease family protein [Clostridium perfringens]